MKGAIGLGTQTLGAAIMWSIRIFSSNRATAILAVGVLATLFLSANAWATEPTVESLLFTDIKAKSAALSKKDRATAKELFKTGFDAWSTGDCTTAEIAFERGLALNPADGRANYYYGDCLFKRHAATAVSSLLRASVLGGNSLEAIKAEAELRAAPDDVMQQAWTTGSNDTNSGSYDEAYADGIVLLTAVIHARPNTSANYLALAYLFRGGHYLEVGSDALALEDFNAALAVNEADANPGAMSGRCFAKARLTQLASALVDCNDVIAKHPDFGDALIHRAFVYYQSKDFADAVSDATAALGSHNSDANVKRDALYLRGVARLKMGDASNGDADILAAKSIDPNIASKYAHYGVGEN